MAKAEMFVHFLEAYFTPSMTYDDLGMLAEKFKALQQQSEVTTLVREVQELRAMDNWDFIRDFVYEHGMWYLPHEKLQAMLDLLIRELST